MRPVKDRRGNYDIWRAMVKNFSIFRDVNRKCWDTTVIPTEQKRNVCLDAWWTKDRYGRLMALCRNYRLDSQKVFKESLGEREGKTIFIIKAEVISVHLKWKRKKQQLWNKKWLARSDFVEIVLTYTLAAIN